MRAWIHSSLFGVPLPERILPSVSTTSSVLALASPGLRRVGMKKVFVPGMRALTCPKALERPKRSMMRLASATSRLSVGSAPRRLFALATRRLLPKSEQRLGNDRRVLFASGERVDRSPRRKGALEPLHRADFSGDRGVRVDEHGGSNRPRQSMVARIVLVGPLSDLHDLVGGF